MTLKWIHYWVGRYGFSLSAACLIACVGVIAVEPAEAQSSDRVALDEVSLRAGVFDIQGNGRPIESGVALTWSEIEFERFSRTWRVWPEAGFLLTADRSTYLYFGYRMNLDIGERWTIRPMLSVGLYDDQEGKDLGGALHFRSGIELGYRIDRWRRLAAEVYHLSNGGFSRPNPGSESVVLTYSVALR